MMRLLAIAASAIVLACHPAVAADDNNKPRTLTVTDVIKIASATAQMNCRQRVIKDGAKETFVCEPYPSDKLRPALAWQIADIQSKVAPVVATYQRAHNQLLNGKARKPDGNLTDEAQVEVLEADAELLAQPTDLVLPRLKRADIEALDLSPATIAGLWPIVADQ